MNVLLVGDSQSGKTTWLNRYKGFQFSESYLATMGVDTDIVYLNERKVIVHDIGAIERYSTSKKAYYDVADGALIFYDVMDNLYKERILYWKSKLNEGTPYIMVANKGDLMQTDTIDWVDVISCKSDLDVETPLRELLEKLPIKEEEPTILTQLLGFVYNYYLHYYGRLLS